MPVCIPLCSTRKDAECKLLVADLETGQAIATCSLAGSEDDEVKYAAYTPGYVVVLGLLKHVAYVVKCAAGSASLHKTVDLHPYTEPFGCCTVEPTGQVLVSCRSSGSSQSASLVALDPSADFAVSSVCGFEGVQWSGGVSADAHAHWAVCTAFSSGAGWPLGYQPAHTAEGKYGETLSVWNLKERKVVASVELGIEGTSPVATCVLRRPKRVAGYVACCLPTTVFYFADEGEAALRVEKVIDVPAANSDRGRVPGMLTALELSPDDRFLFMSTWLHGDIRQYDVATPNRPILVGRLVVGGFVNGSTYGPSAMALRVDDSKEAPDVTLYVSTCFLKAWNSQYYGSPESPVLRVSVDAHRGGLKLDDAFSAGQPEHLAMSVLCMPDNA
ncbi:Selenium-binding protein 2 [Diplonema papillatum]|nr:Selenium-binding protein 2 [Diplonema papillatum]